jgi:hypothetical protein
MSGVTALPPGGATDAHLDTTIGTAADAKVDTDAVGTLSSKLRGIVSLLGPPWTSYTSAAREKTGTVKATVGTLKSCVCSLLSTGAAGFVQAHNAATATPVATATIRFVLGPINPGDVRYYELESMAFAAGIKLAISTTEDTYTAPGTDDALWHARFA